MKTVNQNTIYVVGGVPRAGKSTLRKLFLNRQKVSGFSTDLIRDILKKTYPEIEHFKNGPDLEEAKRFLPLWGTLLHYTDYYIDSWFIEGANFLPDEIAKFKDRNIKSCFLLYSNSTPEEVFERVRKFDSIKKKDWTLEVPDKKLLDFCKTWVADSKFLEEECKKAGIKVFDVGSSYNEVIEEAYQFLLLGK